MKKIISIFLLLLLANGAEAQVAFQFTTAKTYTGASTDTIYFYAPPAFGHLYTHVGNQPVGTDTTTGAADPPKYIFVSDTLDFQTIKTAGPDSAADSSMINIKPLDFDGNIISNDSTLVTAATAITDMYTTDKVIAYDIGFIHTNAPYGIAIIHQIGGNGGTFRAQYRVVWRVNVYK